MNATIRIALIGDHNPAVAAHVAIPRALKLAANGLVRAIEPVWMATPLFTTKSEERLSPFVYRAEALRQTSERGAEEPYGEDLRVRAFAP